MSTQKATPDPFRPGKTPPRRPHAGNTKGRRWPPEPVAVEEVVQLLDACTPLANGRAAELSAMRLRALIAVLWRTGLRISEALDLEPRDLIRQDLAIIVRRGKGGKRRVVAMDEWGWRELDAWLETRRTLPPGPIFCVVRGASAGSRFADCDVRRQLRQLAARAGVDRRIHAHGFRHTMAVELWREGIQELVIQSQLGHVRLDVTSIYLRGLAPVELLDPVGRRRPPMMLIPTRRSS